MRLRSNGDNDEFIVFMRQTEAFPENFTIGLDYVPNDEPKHICLVRCNGPHGEHVNDEFALEPHFGFHIHRATPETIANGLKAEKYAVLTSEYESFHEAIAHFLGLCRIQDWRPYFPDLKTTAQFELFDEPKDRT